MKNRKLVDRAKGILMKSRGLSEEAAYALLRKTAMNQNRKISEIAQSLVTAAGLLGPGDDDDGSAPPRSRPASCRSSTAPCWSSRSEMGFAEAEGVDLSLVRETFLGEHPRPYRRRPFRCRPYAGADADRLQSWTDAARRRDTIVPMALGLGGNCGDRLQRALAGDGGTRRPRRSRPALTGAALRRDIDERARRGSEPLALCRRASAFGPQLRAPLLAGGLRHRS